MLNIAHYSVQFSSVQSLSHVWVFVTLWTAVTLAPLSITSAWSLPKLMSIELVMPSNHLILCCPLLLLLWIFPSIRVFSNESAFCIRWPMLIIRDVQIKSTASYQPTAIRIISVQFSCSVVSDFLWPHGFQHASPLCPSPTPGAYSNSCPLSRWCLPTISSSVIPFSFCLQSFQALGSFPMSRFFASGGQSIGVSASASALPVNI